MIEYFTAGIAVHCVKRFNITLHSAASPAHGNLLQCKTSLLHRRKANPGNVCIAQTTRLRDLVFGDG